MWAQLITVRVKQGGVEGVERIMNRLREAEQPGSGLIRQIVTRDQADPQVIRTLAVFESEEMARARESDPRRAEAHRETQAIFAEILDGPPTFNSLDVVMALDY